MTPQQRAAALRLARTPISERDLQWHGEAAALLRDLAQEPRDWCTDPDNCKRCKAPQWDQLNHSHAGIPVGLQRKVAQEPQDEPAAWLINDKDGNLVHAVSWREAAHEHVNDAINNHGLVEAAGWKVVPAYAHPPQRKPLTHMQAVRLWGHRSDGPSNSEIVSYARAIEAAHDIKETP